MRRLHLGGAVAWRRVALGLGAGAFWAAIEAMAAPTSELSASPYTTRVSALAAAQAAAEARAPSGAPEDKEYATRRSSSSCESG